MINRKAITPVVATALLLVVVVVAVAVFQTWFNSYSSGLFTKIEIQSSNSLSNFDIKDIIANDLYFINSGTSNITITAIKVDDKDCNVSGNFSSGMLIIPLGNNCTQNLTTSTPDVVIYTKNGIYSKNIYVSSNTSTSKTSLCSNLTGGTWVEVPGNSALGTFNFCVMEFEAKCNNSDGSTCVFPTDPVLSQPANTPWVNIDLLDARSACSSLGSNYHLITNSEWTTIARNIESDSLNWYHDHGNYLIRGHSDGNPNHLLSVNNVSNPYDQTNDTNASWSGEQEQRVFHLTNGKTIWDFSGNAEEFVNDSGCSSGSGSGLWYNSSSWIEWTNGNLSDYEKIVAGPLGNYNSSNNVGKYYGCIGDGVILRGGRYNSGSKAGIYSIDLSNGIYSTFSYGGFRCVYSPN